MPTKKPKKVAVVITGTGNAPTEAVHAALQDLFDAYDVTYVVFSDHLLNAGPKDSLTDVANWLVDQDVPFDVCISEGVELTKKISRLVDEAHYTGVGEDSTSAAVRLVADLSEQDENIGLVLWDDENIDATENAVMAFSGREFWWILDLTNALVPIFIEDEEAPEPVKEEQVAEEKTEGFTETELLSMPIATLKRIVTNMGEEFSSHPTKQELVEIILGGDAPSIEEIATATPVKAAPAPAQGEKLPTMVVFYSNGTSVTVNIRSDAQKLVEQILSAAL